MKKIHLIRHAKSSWDNEFLADIERPLNQRGINTCRFMAPHIRNAGVSFSNTFCSPAVRAQSTLEQISKHLPDIAIRWQTDEALYCFESQQLLEWCRLLDESISEVVIIGHNPALTDLCNELSNSNVKNIPTCGYVKLEMNSERIWQNISLNSFELIRFLRPKELLKNDSCK